MGNLWLKIKIWTKVILAVLVLLYVLIFIIQNNEHVQFWWWFNHRDDYSKVLLIGIAFLAGVVCTILLRTTLRTLKQIKELRSRTRTDRIERELADMKDKASRLQTKPVSSGTSPSEVIPPPSDPTD
jgi:uncharacterized integral membrane protein